MAQSIEQSVIDKATNDNGEVLADIEVAHDLQLGSEKKLTILPGATPQSASFAIAHEDHTLGNALRYFINKNPDVEFCGYTIPHPSEPKMHVRVQVWEDTTTTALEVLQKGLRDLVEACDVVSEKFTTARDDFNARTGQNGDGLIHRGDSMSVDTS